MDSRVFCACRRVTGGIASWIKDGWNDVLFIWKLCTFTRHGISLAIWLVLNNHAPYKEDIADDIYARQLQYAEIK